MLKQKGFIFRFILLVLISCIISGCKGEISDNDDKSDKTQNYSDKIKIYYVNKEVTGLLYYEHEVFGETVDDKVNNVRSQLRKRNLKNALEPTIPEELKNNTFKPSGQILVLNFDENYFKAEQRKEILRRAAIVKTFCQLEEFEFVKIVVNDQPLMIGDETIGNMSEDTFQDNIGQEITYSSEQEVFVYFANAFGNKLRKIKMSVVNTGRKPIEELVIEKLIAGPDRIGYFPTLFSDVKINRVTVHNKICYIDFNEKFLSGYSGVTDETVVYSVVNTLTDLESVNHVLITVNGELLSIYNKAEGLSGRLIRNFDINEEND